MWEVRAVAGRVEDLVEFLRVAAHPDAQIYRSAGDEARVVVIDPTGEGVLDVPGHLIAGPAHSWPFELVDR